MVRAEHVWSETPLVSARWRALDDHARIAALQAALAGFDRGDRLRVESADSLGQATLSCRVDLPPGQEGAVLMEAEAHLRAKMGEPIEIYLAERHDENKPRQNRDVIIQWLQTREELRAQGIGKNGAATLPAGPR